MVVERDVPFYKRATKTKNNFAINTPIHDVNTIFIVTFENLFLFSSFLQYTWMSGIKREVFPWSSIKRIKIIIFVNFRELTQNVVPFGNLV